MGRTRWSGFTMVELLVVVAVLAILAGFLVPVFGRAREQARVTKCISNERQIFVALKMYEADYGQLPVQYGPSGKDQWLGMLNSYTKDKRILLCDSDPSHGEVDREGGPFPCSYSYLYTQPNLSRIPGAAYQRPQAVSPLFLCHSHPTYQCVMCRYDGSIELSPLSRYTFIQIELE